MQIKPEMTLSAFASWLQKKCGANGAKLKSEAGRVNCVVNSSHIEPGSCAALFAYASAEGLMVCELSGYFESEAKAWEALKLNQAAYPPVRFDEWAETEYLTDKTARVEQLKI